MKIGIIGPRYVGKTTIIRRLLGAQFSKQYIHSPSVTIYTIFLEGLVIYLYDCSSDERSSDIAEVLYPIFDGVIVVGSLKEEFSYWIDRYRQMNQSGIIFLCLNLKNVDQYSNPDFIYPYYLIDAKTGYGIKRIFNDIKNLIGENMIIES